MKPNLKFKVRKFYALGQSKGSWCIIDPNGLLHIGHIDNKPAADKLCAFYNHRLNQNSAKPNERTA